MRTPEFWRADTAVSRALIPLGFAIETAGRLRRWWITPVRANVPVICVGNPTVGGSGKTPFALALADLLVARGRRPAFLTRGHGGRLKGPLSVDPPQHDADAVGDEALLLAARAPTFVARDRPQGAALAVERGGDILIMDDGFQNPSLAKDLSFLVIDGPAGVGNGRLFPAGPLREPVDRAAARADAAVIIGADRSGLGERLAASLPILTASLTPDPADVARLAGRRLLAFAGIGRPTKFFETLVGAGLTLIDSRPFADHHRYRDGELADLRAQARRGQAVLVTTAKDLARIAPADREGIEVLGVTLAIETPTLLATLLDRVAAR